MLPKSRKYRVRFRIRIQKEASREIDRIVDWVAQKSFRAADSFLKGLKAKILSLASYPDRGARARLLEGTGGSPSVRWIEFKGYLVFYVVDGINITVLHVTAPGQDWIRLFL